MAKKATEYYKEKLEEKRRIVFPLAIAKGGELDHLDRLIEDRNDVGLMAFWGNPDNFKGFQGLRYLSEELKNKREISPEDRNFISKLSKEMKSNGIFFDLSGSIGIFCQVEDLCLELVKKDLNIKVKIPLFFWTYLICIESCINDLSEIFYEIALKKGDHDFEEDFEKSLQEGEHLMFGQLKRYAIKWDLIDVNDNSFLNKTNLRNKIAHANIYYDSERKKIIIKGNKYLEVEDFIKEFQRVFDFFKELIFQLNNSQEDLEKPAQDLIKKFHKEFLKICRSGLRREKWRSIVFDWEKED